MSEAEEVSRAVSALYGSNAQQQAEANRWLMAFAERPAAWDVCRELVLAGPAQEIQFFGANVLHTKVRREWHGLALEARQQAFGALSALVVAAVRREQPNGMTAGLATRMLVSKRLCLALGAAAAQQAELCAPCVQMALELGTGEHGPAGAIAAFALLCALVDEVELLANGAAGGGGYGVHSSAGGGASPLQPPPSPQQHASASTARASAFDLRPFATPVAQLVEAHVATAAGRMPPLAELRRAALHCFRAWAALDGEALSVRALAARHASLLEGLLGALGEQDIAEAAADALCEVCSLEFVSLTVEQTDVHLAASIAERFLRLQPQLKQALAHRTGSSGAQADEWAAAFTRALGQFGACAARPLACASAGGSAESAQLQQLVLLMLESASYPTHAASENLVDAWVSLQDVPMHARVDAMRAPLYEQLLTVTITRCMWPDVRGARAARGVSSAATAAAAAGAAVAAADNGGGGDDDDDDDDERAEFEKWRHQSAAEVITCCLAALGGAFFSSALASLLPAEPPASAEAWTGAWRRIEVVAFALAAVHAELKSKLRAVESQPSAPPTTPTGSGSPLVASRASGAGALTLDKAAVDSALAQLLNIALALPAVAASAAHFPANGANGASGANGGRGGGGGGRGADIAAVVDWRLLPALCTFIGSFGSWVKARPQLIDRTLELLLAAAGAHAPCPGGGSELAASLAAVGRAVPAGAREAPRLHLTAAEAFRNVCAHCSAELAIGQHGGTSLVTVLVRRVCPLLNSGARIVVGDGGPCGQDARVPLAEALGRLVAAVEPIDANVATHALQELVGTPARSLRGLVSRAGESGAGVATAGGARKPAAELCAAMAHELQLITASVRFCDGDASRRSSRLVSMRASAAAAGAGAGASAPGVGGATFGTHPVSPLIAVISEVWPLLEELSVASGGDVLVVDALLDLLARAILCGKALLAGHLPQMLALAVDAFGATRALGALALFKAAIEVHGAALKLADECPTDAAGLDAAPPALRDALAHALAAMTVTALRPLLSAPSPLDGSGARAAGAASSTELRAAAAAEESEPQLLNDFFELMQRVLVFSPMLILGPLVQSASSTPHARTFAQVVDACARCVAHQEPTHTRASITFACQLVRGCADGTAPGAARKGCALPSTAIEPHGAMLTLSCLLGLTSFSAEGLVDHQCELLRVLLQCSAPHLSAQWLAAAFQHRALLEAVAPAGEANSELFLRLLVHRPPLKHDAIAREFSRMCRREGGVDGLGQFVPTA